MRVYISAYGDIVQRGFKIEFNPRIEEDAVTDAILCAILAVGDMSYDEAEQMYSEMLEGYSGDGDSSVIRVNGYRLYVREEKPGHVLHVISEDNIYLNGSSSGYDNYSVDQLLDSDNTGNKVALSLAIKRIVETDEYIILEAFLKGQSVGVYCKSDVFTGCFVSGGEKKLYCELSRPRENYDICLKLDYIKK